MIKINMAEAFQKGLIEVSNEKRVCKNNNIPKIKINKNAIEEISNKIRKGVK